MERGSDKHSPRMDEAMKGEVRGLVQGRTMGDPHAQEWKQPEPSGEDQPDVDRAPDTTLVGGTPAGMTEADVAGRSELARFLHRSVFPADRDALVTDATRNGAPAVIVDELGTLPTGQSYDTVNGVWAALGHGVEAPRA